MLGLILLAHTGQQARESAAKEAAQAAASTLSPCSLRSTDPLRVSVALHADGSTHAVTQAKACLLMGLAKGKTASAPAWGMAASLFPEHKALSAQAEAMLRGQSCTPSPSVWDVIGPLPIGKNEVDADPLAAQPEGSAFAHWLAHHNSTGRHGLVGSELVNGGAVGWKRQRSEPDGTLAISWSDVPWGQLVQGLGQRAVLEVQAWAMGALFVTKSATYVLDCRGVHRALLYDALQPASPPRLINGDLYGSGAAGGFSVSLPAGAFILALRIRTVVQARVHCRLQPAAAEWDVRSPMLLPDIILPADPASSSTPTAEVMGVDAAARLARPRFCGGLAALTVRATGTRWLRDLRASNVRSASPASAAAQLLPSVSIRNASTAVVAPGQSRLVSLALSLPNDSSLQLRCPLSLRFTLSAALVSSATDASGQAVEKEVGT